MHLKGASLVKVLALDANMSMAGKDKHSSLLQNFINFDSKRFYNIGPRFQISIIFIIEVIFYLFITFGLIDIFN